MKRRNSETIEKKNYPQCRHNGRQLSIVNFQLHKLVALLIAAVIIVSAFMTVTFAWQQSQHKTNMTDGGDQDRFVLLQKYEKDVNGNITAITVKDAEFYLYDDTDTQIGGKYTTDGEGKINITGLKPGDYYFIETDPSYGYDYDIDGANKIDRYDFTINDIDVNVIVHAFNRKLSSELKITKEVRNHNSSPLSQEQLSQEFEFTVTFDNLPNSLINVLVNGATKQLSMANPQLLIKLRHGESCVIQGLPVGVTYCATEAPISGYTMGGVNQSGNIPISGITAEFVNTYRENTGELTISKQVMINNGQLTADDLAREFNFTVIFDNLPSELLTVYLNGIAKQLTMSNRQLAFKLSHGEETIISGLPEGMTYTVTEDDANAGGYTAQIDLYTGMTIAGNIDLPFINSKVSPLTPLGSLGIKKVVKRSFGNGQLTTENLIKEFNFTITFGNLPSIPSTILVNGEAKELSSANHQFSIKLCHNETASIANLPMGVTYKVTEDDYLSDGYIATVQEVTGTIASDSIEEIIFENNKYMPQKLLVKKVVSGDVNEVDRAKAFDFTVNINGTEHKFALKNGEEKTFYLPLNAVFTVTEDYHEDFIFTMSQNVYDTVTERLYEFLCTNVYTGKIWREISGEKTWDMSADISAAIPNNITLYLKDGERIVETKTITAADNWKYSFAAAKYRSDGVTVIDYTIEEKTLTNFETTMTKTSEGFDIKNTYVNQEHTTVKATKVWIGNDPYRPASVEVQLYKDGAAYGNPATLNAGNNWTYTWKALEKGAKWTVDEPKVPENYSKTISGDANTGFIITNTFKDNATTGVLVTVSGQKFWNHGTNHQEKQPDSVTFTIYADGKEFVIFAIDVSSHWRYSFELPKYNNEGKEIVYTVDETEVKDYRKSINGYNITNSHKSVPITDDPNNPDNSTGSDNNKGKGGNPKTGDNNHIALWILLMIASASLLAVLLYKSRRKGKHYPK